MPFIPKLWGQACLGSSLTRLQSVKETLPYMTKCTGGIHRTALYCVAERPSIGQGGKYFLRL